MKAASLIYDLTIIGSAEVYIRGVRITSTKQLKEELKKLEEDTGAMRGSRRGLKH